MQRVNNRLLIQISLVLMNKVCQRKVVTVTNRNVGRFVDVVKILASIDFLWCSEKVFLKTSCTQRVRSLKKIILQTSIVDQLNLTV